jgi:hypothetical protein
MDTITQKETKPKTDELKDMVGMLKNVFGDLCNDASISSMLLDINIQDAFSKRVSDVMNKPLTSSFDALQGIELAIKDMLNKSVEDFFTSNKKLIKKVYRLKHGGTVLHYSIILKDDDLNKRSKLYSFISDYKNTKISARFPIVFQSIPQDLEDIFESELAIEGKYETVM